MEVQGGTSEMSGLSLKDNGEKKKMKMWFPYQKGLTWQNLLTLETNFFLKIRRHTVFLVA